VTGDTPAPAFRVVRGHPSEEEVAALLVVLSARATAEPTTTVPPTAASGWASYARAVRAPLQPGPGAWLASARTD
jgi:hypothetical protein